MTSLDCAQRAATFTPSNWNVNQTATITPNNDADASIEVGELYLRLSNGAELHRTFEVYDDDVQMAVSPTALTISEGGAETYKVRLAARIGRARTVNLSSGNPDVTVDADPYTAGIQTSLTFTAANWNTEQTVTVTAGQDDDADDDSATISLTGDGVEPVRWK